MSEVDDSKPHLRSLFDGKMYELEGEMIVGRHAECNIVLDRELGASRKHARFAVVDQDVFVTDLGSLNGTLVNGKEIENEAQLSNGDILIFDENEYEVLIPPQNAEPEIDPNMTVIINRPKVGKRHLSKPAIREIDEWHVEVEAAAAKAAAGEVAAAKDSAGEAAAKKAAASAEDAATKAAAAKAAAIEAAAVKAAAVEAAAAKAAAVEAAAAKAAAVEAAAAKAAATKAAAAKAAAIEAAAAKAAAIEAAAAKAAAIEAAAAKAAAIEAAAAKAASSQRITPEVSTPEPLLDIAEPAAVHRPGSWANSAAVNNSDLTMIAGGVVTMNAQAAQVDLASISEPTIIVQTGENAGTLFRLDGEQTEWSVGSGADRDLRVTHSGVSSNHAAIVREGSKWKVVDQMSVNGTFVNGNRINIRYFNDTDVLRFGPVECLFVVPAGFVGATKSIKNKGKGFSLWKMAVPIAILLILGGGYYAYSSGMFSSAAPPTTTGTQ